MKENSQDKNIHLLHLHKRCNSQSDARWTKKGSPQNPRQGTIQGSVEWLPDTIKRDNGVSIIHEFRTRGGDPVGVTFDINSIK